MDSGVGVGATCANANACIKADAKMTQAIFIGRSYALRMGFAQMRSSDSESRMIRMNTDGEIYRTEVLTGHWTAAFAYRA